MAHRPAMGGRHGRARNGQPAHAPVIPAERLPRAKLMAGRRPILISDSLPCSHGVRQNPRWQILALETSVGPAEWRCRRLAFVAVLLEPEQGSPPTQAERPAVGTVVRVLARVPGHLKPIAFKPTDADE